VVVVESEEEEGGGEGVEGGGGLQMVGEEKPKSGSRTRRGTIYRAPTRKNANREIGVPRKRGANGVLEI
jgi:hypothetical protein